MRILFLLAILLAYSAPPAVAQTTKNTAKSPPTAETVIGLVGSRMSKIFAELGPPSAVGVGDPGQVWLEYDGFSMLIEKGDKTVACAFWPEWKQTVKGLNVSDSQEQMIQKRGKPDITRKDSDGKVEISWTFKDQKLDVVARFRNNKCTRLFVPKWGGADAIP